MVADSFPGEDRLLLDSSKVDYLNIHGWDHNLPPMDIVIHCAGGGMGLKANLLPANDLYQLFMVNLGGAAEINRVVVPGMIERGYGRIVHVCSIASFEAVGSVGYNTIKAALGAYVRSLGRELASSGVVVTGIAPGGFTAPGNSMERLQSKNPTAYLEFVDKRLPRGFMGKAEELIPLIKLLASGDASMMAGSIIQIDAGEGMAYVPD